MTDVEIAKLLAIIAATWKKFEHGGMTEVAIWRSVLADIPYELAEAAVHYLIATHPYPPQPADLRATIAELTLPPDAKMTAAEAWKLVLQEVRRVGYYGRPSLPPLVQDAVDCLGWREICTSEEPEVVRAHFFRVFTELQDRARRHAALPPRLRAFMNPALANTLHPLPDPDPDAA